jgi:hypothetical protein
MSVTPTVRPAVRVRDEKPGVDDSIIDLVMVIAFTVIAVTLIIAVAVGSDESRATILTLSKAVMPAAVVVAAVALGRKVVTNLDRPLDGNAVIVLAAIGSFTVVVLAVVVAVLVGNPTVQRTVSEVVSDYLPVIATLIGAVVGFVAGGAVNERRPAVETAVDGRGRVSSGPLVALAAIVAFAVVVLAVIAAVVYGDSQVPVSLENMISDLLPIIATVVGVIVGFVAGLSRSRTVVVPGVAAVVPAVRIDEAD